MPERGIVRWLHQVLDAPYQADGVGFEKSCALVVGPPLETCGQAVLQTSARHSPAGVEGGSFRRSPVSVGTRTSARAAGDDGP
jgi:hypothetical protein